jgi:uncharacterized membrane protein YeiH
MIDFLFHTHNQAGPLLITLDLLGTFVFALSGASAGVKSRFDLFGLMVLAFAAGNAGGITRDLLIGSVPPAAISDWRFLAVSLLAGFATFLWHPDIDRRRRTVLLLDAGGLALFAVAGTQKALAFGLNPVMAALLGMVTGIGGGIVRDILVNQPPTILHSDLYATAALAASVVVVAGPFLHLPPYAALTIGSLLCFTLRVMAIFYGWHLPIVETRHSRTG